MATSKQSHMDKAQNFFRQYRDPQGELRKLSANQFMEVWSHYDKDANGYIEGTELDGFLREFVSSANSSDVGPEVSECVMTGGGGAGAGAGGADGSQGPFIPRHYSAEPQLISFLRPEVM